MGWFFGGNEEVETSGQVQEGQAQGGQGGQSQDQEEVGIRVFKAIIYGRPIFLREEAERLIVCFSDGREPLEAWPEHPNNISNYTLDREFYSYTDFITSVASYVLQTNWDKEEIVQYVASCIWYGNV